MGNPFCVSIPREVMSTTRMGTHYSQQPTKIEFHFDPKRGCANVRLQGFIHSSELRETFESYRTRRSAGVSPLRVILCDPSEVAGFDWEVPMVAAELLAHLDRDGVERIALVTPSTVLRTTVELLRSRHRVQIGCFLSARGAERWLAELEQRSSQAA